MNTRRLVLFAGTVVALGALFLLAERAGYLGASVWRGGAPANSPFYAPQPSRTAEFLGRLNGERFSDSQIDLIAKNVSYLVISKNEADYNLTQQFSEAQTIRQKAAAVGNPIQIFAYYNATYFFAKNFPHAGSPGWGPYLDTFSADWYLKDASGKPLAFRTRDSTDTDADGYVIDPTNPQYRAWAIATILSWMDKGNFDGILTDNAHPRVGNDNAKRIQNMTWNTALCGQSGLSKKEDAVAPNCDRVNAWNAGLATFMAQLTTALRAQGKQVIYNGIAPGKGHGEDRNLTLIQTTGSATDESFCYNSGTAGGSNSPELTPVIDDIKLMQSEAAAGHKLFMITNTHGAQQKTTLGPYCLGSFLMGWQPGSDYYIYHSYYSDAFAEGYPEIAEQNLNLGNPTKQYVAQGDSGALLTRTFEHGFVAVNTSTTTVGRVTMPDDVVQFKDGREVASFSKGAVIALEPKTARFFLYAAYVPNAR